MIRQLPDTQSGPRARRQTLSCPARGKLSHLGSELRRRHNPEFYRARRRYSGNSIRAPWGRWLNRTPVGKALCDRWRAWLAERVKRYEWEIDPDDARGPTILGLRGTGILARHADGYDVDQIANDIGMSSQMVERYMRFKDQMEIAERGRARLRLVDRKP